MIWGLSQYEMNSYQYRNSHYNGKAVWWPSFLYDYPYSRQDRLYIETGHWLFHENLHVHVHIPRTIDSYKYSSYGYLGYCPSLNPSICYQIFDWNCRLLDVGYFAHLTQSSSANSVQPLLVSFSADRGQVIWTAPIWPLRDPNTSAIILRHIYLVVIPTKQPDRP